MDILSEQKCFGGTQGFYAHKSDICGCVMKFALFLPSTPNPPLLTWLSGLTCTQETFAIKAGAQRVAAELGLAILAPDTSPRGLGLPGEDDDWDFGTGAGFYLDATRPPWDKNYRMQSYIIGELSRLVVENFPVDKERQGIFGHSMGGHGALSLHLKNPQTYRSVSAFAPIVAPMQCPWGEKALRGYLGDERDAWRAYDSCELVRSQPSKASMLVDQGDKDQFLEEQLKPHLLEQACKESGQALNLRTHSGYDHSYYFIQTFVEDHLRHHAKALAA
ncbi:MAG: S-formylglutathione hydrolase [Hyphomicrobiales bacterium]|nr:S-formylglutathione hydrolase [Hyphomicrobiales bacterium]